MPKTTIEQKKNVKILRMNLTKCNSIKNNTVILGII